MNSQYFEVGKTYHCAIYGEVTILEIKESFFGDTFPITALTKTNSTEYYTLDGRYYKDGRVVLSQNPIPEIINVPVEIFKEGDLVIVSDDKDFRNGTCCFRIFSHAEDKFYVFKDGETSGETIWWNYCKKFKQT